MSLSDILGKAAPWLAAAAAGPTGIAAMAIKTAAGALGSSAKTVEDLGTAIAGATPEQLQALKLADLDYRVKMETLGINSIRDLEAISAGDRKDARAMQVANKSFMPAVLTSGVCVAFVGTLAALFFFDVPSTNRDMVVYMVGQLSGAFGTGLAFWFGTTRSSENKTALLAQASPIK